MPAIYIRTHSCIITLRVLYHYQDENSKANMIYVYSYTYSIANEYNVIQIHNYNNNTTI